jgi:hypothetical protein
VHAVPQHTPSAQKPLKHWLVAAHGVPSACCGTHAPPEQ